MRYSLSLATLLFTGLLVSPAFTQSTTATLVGRITDQSGGTIAEARITVLNTATAQDRTFTTDSSGDFTVTNLTPGVYDIAVEKAGFRKTMQSGFELQVNQTARLDMVLSIGATSETVQVTASAPLLNTENATKGDVIAQEEISEMPLNGRSFTDLAYLVPGVIEQVQGGATGGGYVVNGARSDNTNFVVDGFNNQKASTGGASVKPTVESMQEFKVQTSGYSAENGRLSGGVVSMAMKTGTNAVHGAFFDYFRNDALNARNFFAQDIPKLRRNQYGFEFDGPLVLPKLYNGRNKTFFMLSWEGMRQIGGNVRLTPIPTALQRTGDFSQIKTIVKDPLTGVAFPGNLIPASRLDSVARRILNYYPQENQPGQLNNFYALKNAVNRNDQYIVKMDQRASQNDNFSFRIIRNQINTWDPFDNTGDPTGQFGGARAERDSLLGLTYTRLISPTIVNEARFGFSRYDFNKWTGTAGIDVTSALGLPKVVTDPKLYSFPIVDISGYASLGGDKNAPSSSVVNQWQWGDTLSIARGKHLIRAGAEVIRSQYFEPFNQYGNGHYVFNGSWSGQSFADFLLGYASNTERQPGGRSTTYLFATNAGSFVQDDWKVRPNLTINLGVRYELPFAPSEKYGQLSDFDRATGKIVIVSDQRLPNLQQQLAAAKLTGLVVLAKDVNFPANLSYTHYNNLAPRVGFAWRPFGGTNTVVRAGYGIYYGNNALYYLRRDLGNGYPFTIDEKFAVVKGNPLGLTLQDPFPANRAPGLSSVTKAVGYDVNAASPYNQGWNLTIERQIRDSAIEVAYIGSKGTHLGKRVDINQALKDPSLASTTGVLYKPYPGFASVNFSGFNTNSTYHAAQFTFRRRMARGFFYRFNYVFSKSLDYASQLASGGNNGFDGAQDPRNLALEHGRSDSDRRHVFNMNYMYEVQRGGKFVKGWQIAGTGTMYSGVGMTPQNSAANTDLGDATRPDRISSGELTNPTVNSWFDLAALPVVPKGAYRNGTSGRNIIDGPGQVSLNASLMKKFPIRERSYLQFRWEVFNVTNHANFRLPNLDMSSAAAGTITQANDARAMQLALRFVF